MLDFLRLDLRQGLRAARHAPGSTLVIALTLGLAIAGSVAAFGALNATLLRPLPLREPDRLVQLRHDYTGMRAACSPPLFLDYRRRVAAFETISAARPWNANLTGSGEPERLRGLQVSATFFDTLGASASLGRTFTPGEDQPGREFVVVISHNFWRRHFGGARAAVGSRLQLNGESHEVIGVMPPGFSWGRTYGREAEAEIWAPFALTPVRTAEDQRGNEYLDIYARLRHGASRDRAQAQVDATIQELRGRFPSRYTVASGFQVTAAPIQEELVNRIRPGLLLVFAAVVSLLLVAATNVTGLLLTRASGRRRELSVRVALGAGRGRIVAQCLGEASVLAAAAGALGLALSWIAVSALERIDRVALPRSHAIAIDGTVAAFALFVTALVAIGLGLVPAWQMARINVMAWLRTSPHGAGGHESARTRRALIVVQTAIALALLVGAGLLVRSLAELERVPRGFRAQGVVSVQIDLPVLRYGESELRVQFMDDVLGRMAGRLPAAKVAAVSELPLSGESTSGTFDIEGLSVPEGDNQPHAEQWSATPDYFATMGIPLKRGRAFNARDVEGRLRVVVVNEALAALYFPGQDPIGKRIDETGNEKNRRWREIVGVVGNVRDHGLDSEPRPQLYFPYTQRAERGFFLVARVPGDPLSAVPEIRNAVREADKNLPLFNATTMEQLERANTRDRRTARTALAAFAIGAMLLAALGVYGLLAQVVRERVPEIGVRLALGARPADVVRLVFAEGGKLVAWGLVAGVGLSIGTARLFESFVFGVTPADPPTYLSVVVLLSIVALAACALPAWRASRIDPLRALRTE
jgi:putative ABC transport system permease protein